MKIKQSHLCIFFALTNFYFFYLLDNILSLWIAIIMVICANINMNLDKGGF